MNTTSSISLGADFSYEAVTNRWLDTINNGENTVEQESAIVDTLTAAQVAAFEEMLPEGCYWQIEEGSLLYTRQDIDAVDRKDLEHYLARSAEIVSDRLPEIEPGSRGVRGQGPRGELLNHQSVSRTRPAPGLRGRAECLRPAGGGRGGIRCRMPRSSTLPETSHPARRTDRARAATRSIFGPRLPASRPRRIHGPWPAGPLPAPGPGTSTADLLSPGAAGASASRYSNPLTPPPR